MYKPIYAFKGAPETGKTMEVAPGVHWLRMPLPFKLNHINLWLLKDGAGWTIIDTGIKTEEVKKAWREIFFEKKISDTCVKKIIVTHFHPDHIGLAGWLKERFCAPVYITLTEWAFSRMQFLETQESSRTSHQAFYHSIGFDSDLMKLTHKRMGRYATIVSPIPQSIVRISDGDNIEINGESWSVIIGKGHAPEQATLFNNDAKILISGDQVLPRISPNISVVPSEPEGNPLKLFLTSLDSFRSLPEDTLVLPSHDWPFLNLIERLDDLSTHHQERLDKTLEICSRSVTGMEILRGLFERELDDHQLFFAVGESLAHVNYLLSKKMLKRDTDKSGVYWFCS